MIGFFLLARCCFGTVWIKVLHKKYAFCHALQSTSTMERSWGYNSGKKQYFANAFSRQIIFYARHVSLKLFKKMSKENNLWFLFDYFAMTLGAILFVLDTRKKLSNALHLNAVFTKENKIKTKLYKSMFMYSPWICLLMMGVGVTDYYRSTSFLPDKQLSVDFRLLSKIINLWFHRTLNLTCRSVCLHSHMIFTLQYCSITKTFWNNILLYKSEQDISGKWKITEKSLLNVTILV